MWAGYVLIFHISRCTTRKGEVKKLCFMRKEAQTSTMKRRDDLFSLSEEENRQSMHTPSQAFHGILALAIVYATLR
jgi:hypothetical protein